MKGRFSMLIKKRNGNSVTEDRISSKDDAMKAFGEFLDGMSSASDSARYEEFICRFEDDVLDLVDDIARGSCSLHGYCYFADSIVWARRLLGVREDGSSDNRKPSEDEIAEFSRFALKTCKSHCACPCLEECDTAKFVCRLAEMHEEDDSSMDNPNVPSVEKECKE